MANMSYCRFRNTAGDLNDCLTALDPYENEYEISEEEVRAGVRMFDMFLDYCQCIGLIEEYDRDRIAEHFKETNAAICENKGGGADDE
jgi:hypothetical protein